jgi:hypothetical protein
MVRESIDTHRDYRYMVIRSGESVADSHERLAAVTLTPTPTLCVSNPESIQYYHRHAFVYSHSSFPIPHSAFIVVYSIRSTLAFLKAQHIAKISHLLLSCFSRTNNFLKTRFSLFLDRTIGFRNPYW